LAKKAYTVLIVSQKAAQVKKFILSPLTLKISAIILSIGILVSSYIIYDYVVYKKQLAEIQALRVETDSQQKEIHLFLRKINLLEEQLNKLKEMEKQMERDLKEITELKKGKKVYPVAPRKKTSSATKEVGKEVSFSREEEVTILDKERSRLVGQLHQDLLQMRKEAFHTEQSLQELKDFLQAQKSILLSVPSLWPVVGRITSAFGDTRECPSSGGTKPHSGVDISVPLGTPVLAPADGVIRFAGRESEYGRLVRVDHGNGFSTCYGHLKEFLVQVGDKIRKGQPVGTVGISGNSTGPHLHYEVLLHGNRTNPLQYLN